jgi:DNA-binding winged helix-turn-helix (wHTH) protein/Tol biopolymer transport system component
VANNNKLILGKCEYDPESRTISPQNSPPQVIGHVQAKLLQLLYSSPNVYFSNDDLQKEVWDGRYIENTTIRTTVSYLRKALGESEDCKYIDSGRNKGYRFVADIEEITAERQLKKFSPFVVIAALAMLLVYVVMQTNTPRIIPKIQTTLLGQEVEAFVNGEFMVFSHKPEGSQYWNLYSKKIGKERYYQLTNGSFNDRDSAISEDGNWLAFNRHDGKNCQIIVANLSKFEQQLTNAKKVFDCPDELPSVSVAWKDNNNLYLSYSKTASNKYALYLLSIETAEIKNIVMPALSGRGDYFVTRNDKLKKIAYLRNVLGTKTEIWLYDETSSEPTKLVSIPLILMSIGWLDDSRLVVRTGHGKLSSLDINNGELKTLFETDNTIHFPYVINNASVGYMSGFFTVKDIIKLEQDGTSENIISSSFSDYGPVYAEKEGSIAFISNRTGKNQIWLLKQEGELLQVTNFKKYLKIDNLTISDDGQYIAFVINGHLQVIGTDGSLKFNSKEPYLYENPVFSKDSTKVFYTSNIDGEWFIESRLMSNLAEKSKIIKGYVIKPCSISECFYLLKKNDSMLYKSEKGALVATGVSLNNISLPEQFAINGDLIYYLNREGNKSELLRQNMVTKEIISVIPMSTARFSIQKNPLRVYTSIYREPDTFLQSIVLQH